MITPKNSPSKDAIYREIWERIARNQRARESRTWAGRLRSVRQSAGRSYLQWWGLLARPLAVALAGGLVLLVLGAALFLALDASGGPEEHAIAAPVESPAQAVAQPLGNLNPQPAREASSAGELAISGTDGFMVRLATFRDPGNAERLAAALERELSPVRTTIGPDGLHTVTLGPFARRTEAEAAANAIQKTLGLAPQILPPQAR